ncbi:MAG: chemotaxis protein CheV [Lachnospiraceae bacterium]|nr:chemotaxis protein CheV [Lachnospiraceae bacterium]
MDTKILLENGTNELEILEFKLGENSYGINVAKINEIIPYQAVTPVPNSHPSIEGIFMPRETMITAIDLRNALQLGESKPEGLFIITNFNKLDVAFHVDKVVGINRFSWKQIIKPDATINNDQDGISTGVIKMDGRLVIILDFEKIVTDISPETGLKLTEIDALGTRERSQSPILIAEDSHLLNKLISDALTKAGYINQKRTEDGLAAWNYINECLQSGDLDEKIACVITDIEMPQMDGHRLTKLIKSDDRLRHLPVVIFSSLVNEEMRRKGEALGADAQLSKPEIGKLVQEIDKLLQSKG